MVTSLLPALAAILQQILASMVMSLTLAVNFLLGDAVAPASYAAVVSGPVQAVASFAAGVSGSGDSVRVSVVPVTPADSAGRREGKGATSLSERISGKIDRIDRIVSEVKPKINADSLRNVAITVPVPDTASADTAVYDEDSLSGILEETIASFDGDISEREIQRVAMIVTLLITVVCFGIPFLTMIVIIGLILNSRVKFQRERLRSMEKIVMSGHKVPSELLNSSRLNPLVRRANFSSAVRWLAVGIGFLFFFWLVSNNSTLAFSLAIVPLLVGAVKLALFFYDARFEPGCPGDYLPGYSQPDDCATASEGRSCADAREFPPQFTGLDHVPGPDEKPRF